MTLGEWIPEYLTAYKLHTIKDNSYYSLELVTRHIPQELKDMELEDIRPMHLQRFFNDFAQCRCLNPPEPGFPVFGENPTDRTAFVSFYPNVQVNEFESQLFTENLADATFAAPHEPGQ